MAGQRGGIGSLGWTVTGPVNLLAVCQAQLGLQKRPSCSRLFANANVVARQVCRGLRYLPFEQGVFQFLSHRLRRQEAENPVMAGILGVGAMVHAIDSLDDSG